MRRLLVSLAILVTVREARAERTRFFPSLSLQAGIKPGDVLFNGWLGLDYHPGRDNWTSIVSLGAEFDFHDNAVRVIPMARFGVGWFTDKSLVPIFRAYVMAGWFRGSTHDDDGDYGTVTDGQMPEPNPALVDQGVRLGTGIQLMPLLFTCKTGYCLPDQVEFVVDLSNNETVPWVRVGWAF